MIICCAKLMFCLIDWARVRQAGTFILLHNKKRKEGVEGGGRERENELQEEEGEQRDRRTDEEASVTGYR